MEGARSSSSSGVSCLPVCGLRSVRGSKRKGSCGMRGCGHVSSRNARAVCVDASHIRLRGLRGARIALKGTRLSLRLRPQHSCSCAFAVLPCSRCFAVAHKPRGCNPHPTHEALARHFHFAQRTAFFVALVAPCGCGGGPATHHNYPYPQGTLTYWHTTDVCRVTLPKPPHTARLRARRVRSIAHCQQKALQDPTRCPAKRAAPYLVDCGMVTGADDVSASASGQRFRFSVQPRKLQAARSRRKAQETDTEEHGGRHEACCTTHARHPQGLSPRSSDNNPLLER